MYAGNDNALYVGEVRHARYRPRTHRFTYRVFSAFLNVDDIDAKRLNLKLLSIDRFNLFSIRRRDHGPKTARRFALSLRAYWPKQGCKRRKASIFCAIRACSVSPLTR